MPLPDALQRCAVACNGVSVLSGVYWFSAVYHSHARLGCVAGAICHAAGCCKVAAGSGARVLAADLCSLW